MQLGNKYTDPRTLLEIIYRLLLMPRRQEGSIPEVSILKRIRAPLSFPASSGDARLRNLAAFCQFIRAWADQAADDWEGNRAIAVPAWTNVRYKPHGLGLPGKLTGRRLCSWPKDSRRRLGRQSWQSCSLSSNWRAACGW